MSERRLHLLCVLSCLLFVASWPAVAGAGGGPLASPAVALPACMTSSAASFSDGGGGAEGPPEGARAHASAQRDEAQASPDGLPLDALSVNEEGRAGVAEAEASARLELMAMLVDEELALKPVPKHALVVTCGAGVEARTWRTSTSFEGRAALELPAGSCRLESERPLPFAGREFSWTMDITLAPGQVLALELSNDNATISEPAAARALGERRRPASEGGSTAVALNEGEIFRRYRESVFKVMAEAGHGTGFLVDERGLVLTNHHVVAGSDYLAVKIDARRKACATLVAEDEANDLALLRVAPELVEGLVALPFVEDRPERAPYGVGERLVAIGSPLTTESILSAGIVSKVEEGALYTDVAINPGNSGGPLIDVRGDVVGIATFGLRGSAGPGLGGAVRSWVAFALLERARAKLAAGEVPAPEPRLLPVASTYRFSPQVLREHALKRRGHDPRGYHVEAGRMDVQFVTPMVVAQLEVAAERKATEGRNRRQRRRKEEVKPYEPGQDFYEWRRYAGDYRALVTIQAIPEIRMTGESVLLTFFAGYHAPQEFRFKTDFERMELYRDDVLIEPIHPGRFANVVSKQSGNVGMHDVGFFGAYQYPPEAFLPGAEVVLKVWEQGRERPKVRTLDRGLLARIQRDFEPYYEGLEAAAGEGADALDPANRPPEVRALEAKLLEGWATEAEICEALGIGPSQFRHALELLAAYDEVKLELRMDRGGEREYRATR